MLEGIKIKSLVRHCDDRGWFMELLRDDDELLERFGQTSCTLTYPGIIKAFHWHKRQDDIWFVASGEAKVVLHDIRPDSPTCGQTQVVYAGENAPQLIIIPSGIAHGYKVLGDRPVVLFYHTTRSYDGKEPDEERIPYDDPQIGFDWS
ncbi:MAG: dTDP-4-dehydrorhamnose 3,5-epimerase family protein [Candidatus Geothermincolia bacterium]